MSHTPLFLPPNFSPPAPGSRYRLPVAGLGALAPTLAELAARLPPPLLLLAANAADAQRLLEELPFYAPHLRLHHFPDREILPYDPFSPHPDLISQRLSTLRALAESRVDLLLTSLAAVQPLLPPPSFIAARAFSLTRGESLDLSAFRARLAAAGYDPVSQVLRPGEYAIRGGILDLYPMGAPLPYRIELFDNEIETIKTFDPDTQRTLYPVPAIQLLPAREIPTDEEGRTTFRRRFRAHFEGDPSRIGLYQAVSKGHFPAGIESYLPLFFDQTATLFDHAPTATIITLGDLAAVSDALWRDAQERHRLLNTDPDRPLLPPSLWLLSPIALHASLKNHPRIDLTLFPNPDPPLPPLALDPRATRPAAALATWLTEQPPDHTTVLVVQTEGRRATLCEKLAVHDLTPTPVTDWPTILTHRPSLAIAVAPLEHGFHHPTARITLLAESELFAHLVRTSSRNRSDRLQSRHDPEALFRDLTELTPGVPVVHLEHGIGRYRGLVRLTAPTGEEAEFLHLEYADETSLYVPVTQLNRIARYFGADPDHAPLHALGSGQWEREKRKAAEKAHDTAAELLALYAERASRAGISLPTPPDYDAFAAAFPFETTPDQQEAIDAVLADLASGRIMDRLICGDVGFGKTEVALRAAFVAVMNGKQVALLAPTTLLAEQHAETFRNRFASWPVRIAELSRFQSSRAQRSVVEGIAHGTVDIVIGTHRLLQPDVRFARLGLVIIDEEHRFGVRQKEQLRKLAAEVHTLTLTATPIPRTLSMALEGLRDLSVIATPPAKRLSVKTFVVKKSDALIREAVARELRRGGQIFYVHNEIRTIEQVRAELTRLLPGVTIAVAHGEMSEIQLERIMRDFIHQRIQLLLCTTIIETGIDIPNVNTILIDRADRFGLAQLHQLRGRVGRSHHQAFAYLLLDPHLKPTPAAQRRLEAIAQADSLGAGFTLALQDLEIRGAGEILGEAQSGAIQAVGLALYTDLLKTAVRLHQTAGLVSVVPTPSIVLPDAPLGEIHLGQSALLPSEYLPDISLRLALYKELADASDDETLTRLTESLIDRFGPLPPPAQTLIAAHRLRLKLTPFRVTRLDATAHQIAIRFAPDVSLDAAHLVHLLQTDRTLRLKGSDTIIRSGQFPTLADRLAAIDHLLQLLFHSKTHVQSPPKSQGVSEHDRLPS
ncbi:MAG: transcription-repair coupling factor [Hydrogenophilus sp.]|nr:transcription-repair coupling factor [Hydrogenophilus sp.]